MFIILRQDEWSQYAIVENHLGKPKEFKSKEEAFDSAQEFELCPFQIIQVSI
jgi:hypothetical protein